jgi:predicted PurR-regulated permease PerM
MPLTLNQFLFLVITIAIVVAVSYLVSLFIQLRKTAAEGERALIEIRELAKNLRMLDQIVKTKIDEMTKVLEASKKAATNVSEAAVFLTTKIIRPSSSYLPILLPFLRLVWRQWKKRKEKKNGK